MSRQLPTTLAGVIALGIAACSASGQAPDDDGESTGQGASGSGTPAGGTFSSGTAGAGVGGGCAGTTILAEKTQLDIYIMLDKSSSMFPPESVGRWAAVTAALKKFVQEPGAAGIGVGLQYFPVPNASCPSTCQTDADCSGACSAGEGAGNLCVSDLSGQSFCMWGSLASCRADDYAVPDVPIAPLPANAQPILASIDATGSADPSAGTPSTPALKGAIQHAREAVAANPGHVVVVAYATDGQPTRCDEGIAPVILAATDGHYGTPEILTYVIGVGDKVPNLDEVAKGGGTGKAFLVEDGTAEQQFLAALDEIAQTVMPCSYAIPPAPSGEQLDYGSVNVAYTPSSGGTSQTLPKASGLAGCPTDQKAWYYDSETNPTQIILCPSTCDEIKGNIEGRIDVVLGCYTVPL